jgi:hypothetical protein
MLLLRAAMFAANLSWTSGASMKERMARYARTVQLIAITRDRSEGHISISKRGQPVIHYWPGPAEQEHLLTGAEHNLRVLAAAGAHEVSNRGPSGRNSDRGPEGGPPVPGQAVVRCMCCCSTASLSSEHCILPVPVYHLAAMCLKRRHDAMCPSGYNYWPLQKSGQAGAERQSSALPSCLSACSARYTPREWPPLPARSGGHG